MRGRFRLPMFVVAIALLGLIALLATLQYRWLGRISDAERERMTATLNTRASGFAQDFDSELTRAYLLFQVGPTQEGDNVAAGVAARYDRWQATARYPRMIKELYLIPGGGDAVSRLERFNPSTRFLEPAEWPASLQPVRAHLSEQRDTPARAGTFVVRTMATAVWDTVPALVIPAPLFFFNQRRAGAPDHGNTDFGMAPRMSFTVLLLDREYLTNEMLPALAQQHFRQTGDGFDYQVAVVSTAGRGVVYHSAAGFSPTPDAPVDAAVDLFQVRMQDFGALAAEVRRFTTFAAASSQTGRRRTWDAPLTVREQIVLPPLSGTGGAPDIRANGAPAGRVAIRQSPSVSIILQQNGTSLGDAAAAGTASAASRVAPPASPRWRLLVKHPSGSLEQAVNTARRRNLMVSSSILAVLGASVGLLILSTRRAHELARQQMEFVAAVSHELRTPLAVIRSAGDNLADGVVRDDEQIRKYGDLVRNEGRRLTEMVEQILELAGIQSGQRGFALRPVAIAPMLGEVVESSRALIDAARMQVDYTFADGLAPVLGDETALRRVFQNLVANAIKYGASGGWIGLGARQAGREVHVTVADRGIGIAPAEQSRIFEPFYRTPDVIAAQIQGAGLGLSLVRRIVDAHGGRITVHSAPGAGSEFTVVLPAASEASVEPVGRAAVSEAHGHGSGA